MSEFERQSIIDRVIPKGKTVLSIDAVEIIVNMAITETLKASKEQRERQERCDKYGEDIY